MAKPTPHPAPRSRAVSGDKEITLSPKTGVFGTPCDGDKVPEYVTARWLPTLVAVLLMLPPVASWLGCNLSSANVPLTTDTSENASDKPAGQLLLTGSSTIAPLMAEIAARFEERNLNVRIDVQMGGSSRGVADAQRGLADIGMVSRDLSPDEAKLLHAFPVARDGICMIVHQDNPIASLTSEQIIAIYKGQLNNWSEVGGTDAQITVVGKADGRSTLELFLKHFNLKSTEIDADVIIGDNQMGIKTVAGNPGAIGYVSIGTAEFDSAAGVPIKLLPLDGVEATTTHVLDGSYPLARTLHIVTRDEPNGLKRQFIDFARSADVQDIVRQQYFVPLAP